jgi:NAD(P)-dependent dehydrogenase (short-subunit alcohol dehydrogenase family)
VGIRTTLVTGSTSGIGRATALTLARGGSHVVVSGCDTQRGQDVVAQIRADGGTADFVSADLRDARSTTELAATASELAEAAGGCVDLLVNNAGIGSGGPTAGADERPSTRYWPPTSKHRSTWSPPSPRGWPHAATA